MTIFPKFDNSIGHLIAIHMKGMPTLKMIIELTSFKFNFYYRVMVRI